MDEKLADFPDRGFRASYEENLFQPWESLILEFFIDLLMRILLTRRSPDSTLMLKWALKIVCLMFFLFFLMLRFIDDYY